MNKLGVYSGEEILIEEMPQGCIITPIMRTGDSEIEYIVVGDSIRISSKQDAIELIESLERMLKIQYGVTINEQQ